MMVTQLATQIDFREKIIPIAFWVTRSRSNFWSLSKHCQVNILGTIRMIITKRRTVGANSEWIIHCILVCATLWDFAPGGGGGFFFFFFFYFFFGFFFLITPFFQKIF